jgi:ABC-type nickel/cobalt efflux system permease component RcnA
MGKAQAIRAKLAALVLLVALAIAPLVSALTHGPGQLAIKADHTLSHTEQSAHRHATDHGHQDAADHDHTPTVILPAGGELHLQPQTTALAAQTGALAGTIRDGPRRPPRLT